MAPKTGSLQDKFQNFDDKAVFDHVTQAARDANAQNFVVLFGPHHAKIALDLDTDEIKNLWHLKNADYPVRWINFWNTSRQKDSIKIIGNHYGFSRRLRASITYWDYLRMCIKKAAEERKKEAQKADEEPENTATEKTDLESGDSSRHVEVPSQFVGPSSTPVNPETLENFKVLQDSLNYTTTDHGKHCQYTPTRSNRHALANIV